MPKRKNEKVVGLMKDALGEEIMTEFAALKPKPCSYLTDDNNEDEKAKSTKTCAIPRKVKFEDYNHWFERT